MLQTVEGIITRTVKYGESSLILDLLCPDGGIKSFIVGGVRKKGKNNKSALVRPVNIVKVEAYTRDDDRLSRIKEISYSYIYKNIPFDVVKSSIALFLVEICRKAVKASDDAHGIYHYIVKGLIHLDNSQEGLAHFHITFLIGLAKYLGFEMTPPRASELPFFDLREGTFVKERNDHRLVLHADVSKAMKVYLTKDDLSLLSRNDRSLVIQGLVDYFTFHIEDFGDLNSLDVLMSLYR